MLKKIVKGIKNFMDDGVRTCVKIASSAQNRLIAGLVIVGLGIGLVASAYLKVV